MRWRHRVRLAVNLLNGSTLAGLGVAAAGGARVARFPDGLLVGTGYRLPLPPAPAFTLGNVILTRRSALGYDTPLLRHEARHSTQYAWCGGLAMLPLYFTAAGASWLASGDAGAWNVFERGAGLADGGYNPARPLRPALGNLRPALGNLRPALGNLRPALGNLLRLAGSAPGGPRAAGQAAPGPGPG